MSYTGKFGSGCKVSAKIYGYRIGLIVEAQAISRDLRVLFLRASPNTKMNIGEMACLQGWKYYRLEAS